MGTKEQSHSRTRKGDDQRVTEIEREIAIAVDQGDPSATQTILTMLEELRRQGVSRSHYNLASPYGHGMTRCAEEQNA